MTTEAALMLPSWLDKAFAEASLKDSDASKDFKVASVSVQRATASGDNYMSEVYRMTVQLEHTVKQCNSSLSLIIKIIPAGEMMQKMAQEMEAFEHETLMFSKTLPAMSEILKKAAPGKYTQLSAKCFASGKQPVSYLVLEDLKVRGFTLAKRSRGLDLAHSKLVVRKLAEFHATSIQLFEQNPAAMDSYKIFKIFEGPASSHLETFLKQGCRLLADQLDTLEESYSKYAPRVRALADNIFSRTVDMMKQKSKFRALTHADTWVNNIMFKYSEGAVGDVVLLDFQLSAYASPSIDLQYFMHTSLSEEVYVDHLMDLLEEYHDHLIEVMNDLDISADKQISFEELLEDFESHSLYAIFSAIAVLPIVRTQEETRFDVEASINESDSAANRNTFASAQYMQAIKQMLPEFEKRGLL